MTEPVDRRRQRGTADGETTDSPSRPQPYLWEDPSLMASAERRYVEVFYDLADEYPKVYASNDALATWLRLLMLASGVWPAPAVIPRSANDDALALLVECGLIQILDGDMFRVRGLDKLRRARRERAQKAAAERWNPSTEDSAPAMQTHSESNAQAMPHSIAQLNSTEDTQLSDIQRRDNARFASERGIHPSFINLSALVDELVGISQLRDPFGGYTRQLTDLVDIHGESKVVETMRMVRDSLGRTTIRDLVFNTGKVLAKSIDTAAAAKEEKATGETDRARRAVERTLQGLHYSHTEPHPQCPACRDQIAG